VAPRAINPISVSLDATAIARPGHYALIGVIDPDNAIVESIDSNNQALAVSPCKSNSLSANSPAAVRSRRSRSATRTRRASR
jgi:hypothetical protein